MTNWSIKTAAAIRWFLVRPVRAALQRSGRMIVNQEIYGLNPFVDIKRLSRTWQYSIDTFFDVGAHDGGTIIRARRDFDNCRIIAFEPHPKTFARLTKNAVAFVKC